MNTLSREHIAWVDLLRVLACFLVIVSHSCDPFVGQYDNNYSEFLTGALIGSSVRCSVPLFIMMSGLLLLPIKMDMKTFYAKRAKRLLWPFIFWSLALPVLYFLYVNSGIEIVNPNIASADYTIGNMFQKMYLFVFNFNYDTTPLWYAYMLIGLYLFMPIISAWLVQAEKKDIQWFLGIWLITTFLPIIQFAAPFLGYPGAFGNMGLLGVCDWNPFGTFYYFSGFLGYVVLAYYLKRFPIKGNMAKTLKIAIPLFLLGYVLTAGGYLLMHHYYPEDYVKLEIIWFFSGINVFFMTFAAYIVMQKFKIKGSSFLTKLAGLTFGIYLCHFIFVELGYDVIYPNIPVPAFLKIILIAISSFAMSSFVIWLMSLNKYTRKVIM